MNKEYETEKMYNQIVAENMVGYIMCAITTDSLH